MTRGEKAEQYFRQGYNCSQAMVLAFADLLPESPETLARMASSFGGGFGRLREVCGAVSGMGIVLGYLYGYEGPETGEVKAAHYARIQACALEFRKLHETVVCRELLELHELHLSPVPTERTAAFYEDRPCPVLIRDAGNILENYITENPPAVCGRPE